MYDAETESRIAELVRQLELARSRGDDVAEYERAIQAIKVAQGRPRTITGGLHVSPSRRKQ